MPKFPLAAGSLRSGAVLGFLIFLMVVAVTVREFAFPGGNLPALLHPIPVAGYLIFCAALIYPAEQGPAPRLLTLSSLAVAAVSLQRLLETIVPGWRDIPDLPGTLGRTVPAVFDGGFAPETAFALATLHLALLAERRSGALAVALLACLWTGATLTTLGRLFDALFLRQPFPAVSLACMILAAMALTHRLRRTDPVRPLFALGSQSHLLRLVIVAAVAISWATALAYAHFAAVPPAGHRTLVLVFGGVTWMMIGLPLVMAHALAQTHVALTRAVERDPLTGIMSRRGLTGMASVETGNYGAVLFDLDHFRAINDRLGHDMGDRLLQKVATTVASHLRQTDIFGRWEGEQFLVVMRARDEHQLALAAERLRKLVETLGPVVENGENMPLTASFGISMVEPSETNIEGAVKRADMALFAAKTEGRNCVVPASTLSPEQTSANAGAAAGDAAPGAVEDLPAI